MNAFSLLASRNPLSFKSRSSAGAALSGAIGIAADAMDQRMEALVTAQPIMLFMKGTLLC